MMPLLVIGLYNALVTTLLALLVFGVTRYIGSPQWRHTLWLLVLVKLVTPPLFDIPVWFVPASTPVIASNETQLPPQAGGIGDFETVDARPSAATLTVAAGDELTRIAPAGMTESSEAIQDNLIRWSNLVAIAWAGGSITWLIVFGVRVIWFRNFLQATVSAPTTWKHELADFARRLGLRRWPELRLTDGTVPPLLWAIGSRPLILLPRRLLDELDTDGRHALLAHELAHYYRRDHWVRWLEAVVIATFWWHPVAWWSRRNLHTAEEYCCDLWAVWLLNGNTRSYCEALLATINFLSTRRPPVLWGASTMAHFTNIKTRFEMILQDSSSRLLSWRAKFVVALLALIVLPLSLHVAVTRADEGTRVPESPRWRRVSPFTEVIVGSEAVNVAFDKKAYELISIDGVPTNDILVAARRAYGDLWEKRFVEDIFEVMEQAGRKPGQTVKLVLRDPKSSAVTTVERAPLTSENRRKVYEFHAKLSSATAGTAFRPAPSLDYQHEIQRTVVEFVAAAEQNDIERLAKTLSGPGAGKNRELNYIKSTKELVAAGVEPADLRSIALQAGGDALAVTDFFDAKDQKYKGMVCVVYRLTQRDGKWLILDVELEDVKGLIREVSFKARAR